MELCFVFFWNTNVRCCILIYVHKKVIIMAEEVVNIVLLCSMFKVNTSNVAITVSRNQDNGLTLLA